MSSGRSFFYQAHNALIALWACSWRLTTSGVITSQSILK